jgi:hypothetical protein
MKNKEHMILYIEPARAFKLLETLNKKQNKDLKK